jgi:hypothetical protein
MRRIVLISATLLALAFPALGQSEDMTIEQLTRPGNRIVFANKLKSDTRECPTIDARETTPLKAPRLGRTVHAEALVYTDSTVGYVYLLAYGNGPYEVYFSSYTKMNCRLDEAQSHGRVFVGDDRFRQARSYYHNLFNELSE